MTDWVGRIVKSLFSENSWGNQMIRVKYQNSLITIRLGITEDEYNLSSGSYIKKKKKKRVYQSYKNYYIKNILFQLENYLREQMWEVKWMCG